MSYKEHDFNRNAWNKVAEKIAFHTKWYIQCRYEKLAVHLQWQRTEELGQLFLPQKCTF